jgi:CCR4-NOT transcription complex subunit 1
MFAACRNSLAELLVNVGYNILASPSTFSRVLLSHYGSTKAIVAALSEKALGRAVGTIAMTHSDLAEPVQGPWSGIVSESKSRKVTWDTDVFVAVILQYAPTLDWAGTMKFLDFPEFLVNELRGFEILLEIFRKASKSKKWPINVLFTQWKNPFAQYTLLAQAVSSPPDLFNFADYSPAETKKIVNPEELAIACSSSSRTPITSLPNQALNSLDVLATFVRLLDNEKCTHDVSQFLFNASVQAPELLLLGLAQLPLPWSLVHSERVSTLLKEFLLGRATSSFVLPRIWAILPSEFLKNMLELYLEDTSRVGRFLEVAQELKCLSSFLKSVPFPFALDLAARASRREYLNLEKWIADMCSSSGEAFFLACIEFVRSSSISPETASLFVKCLEEQLPLLQRKRGSDSSAKISQEAGKETPGIDLTEALSVLKLRGNTLHSDLFHQKEVEEQAIHLFDMLYKGEMPLSDFVTHMVSLKSSRDEKSQSIFNCILTTFMEEAKFFPTYPERTLYVAGAFVGQLIAHELLPSTMVDIALNLILEFLNQSESSKLHNFGLRALEQFLSRVGQYPQFAKKLLGITALSVSQPDIVKLVEEVLPGKPFRSIQVDESLVFGLAQDQPPDSVHDKILFLVNNLSPSNIDSKAGDFLSVLPPKNFRWFANYLVAVRAAIEPNFQPLYLQLLSRLESRSLYCCILYETYVLTEDVLNSDKAAELLTERSKLKNIGSWLGSLTLGRNEPIMFKHLALKELLLEGYEQSKLMIVVPFVCKVLEQAKHSKVFVPPNPWLMAVLGLLVELYHFSDIKLNLKFEIEVLCKNMSIELSDVRPSSILRSGRYKNNPAINSNSSHTHDGFSTNSVTFTLGSQQPSLVQHQIFNPSPAHASPPGSNIAILNGVSDSISVTLANLSSHIIINPSVAVFESQPGLIRLVHLGFDRAIREVLPPVVERSVTIAAVSARELILKDFSMEPDEKKMRAAAQLMVQQLSGSLALVTCKEPLRLSMMSHLRSLLAQNGLGEQVISDSLLVLVVAENLDVCCGVIERAAMEKSIPEIDDQLSSFYLKRKQVRELGKQFIDPSASTPDYRSRLALFPDQLRLKLGGLSAGQLAVYNEFSGLNHSSISGYSGESNLGKTVNPEDITMQQAIERFTKIMDELSQSLSRCPDVDQISEFPSNHEVKALVRQIPQLSFAVSNSGGLLPPSSKDDLILMFCSKVIQPLFSSTSSLCREVYSIILRELCSQSVRVGREVVQWLLLAEDERKYNPAAICVLIRCGLLLAGDVDLQVARSIEQGKSIHHFAMELVNLCSTQKVTHDSDWFNTVDVLNRLVLAQKAPETVKSFISRLRKRVSPNESQIISPPLPTPSDVDEFVQLKEQLAYTFAEWVRLYQHPNTNEVVYSSFISEMHRCSLFSTDDTFCLFFRVCTELSIDSWFKGHKSSSSVSSFQAIDAYAKLIIMLLKYGNSLKSEEFQTPKGTPSGETISPHDAEKVSFFSKVLSILVLVIVRAHEKKKGEFNQRPYFRLFASLLHELNLQEKSLEGIYFSTLQGFCNMLHTLQPSLLPGFTFSWLSVIAHRQFMPKLLLYDGHKGWPLFSRLLLDFLRFLVPFLRDQGSMRDPTRLLYRGTLRLLLVLLHDFPEFLCDHYFSLCVVIPPSCLQLRNLVLSAFPRNMRLPDPFTPNLRMSSLSETRCIPTIDVDPLVDLVHSVGLSSEHWDPIVAASKLRLSDNGKRDETTGSLYDVSLINAMVFLAGHQEVKSLSASPRINSPAVDASNLDEPPASMLFYRDLMYLLDSEGRYHVISSIANHLRFPNAHTRYFSELILFLFSSMHHRDDQEKSSSKHHSSLPSLSSRARSNDVLQEQITRVLLERLIVNRPHPWGLLVTFIELIKDPRYVFWSYDFTRCAPDIERLFESVSRSVNHQ